jgi:lipopolysaccharide export system protein LptC
VMKRLDKEEQLTELAEVIFVPTRAAARGGSSGVELRTATFSSPGELSGKEAAAMEATSEKISTSPQRKLVKFFEHSREGWKAKARAAKTVLKRLGTRLGRVEQRNAVYQEQLAALPTQVADWQARHEETGREREELKKKYPGIRADR